MPTPEQIAAWKEQHGQVIEVVVGEQFFYLRKPTREEFRRFIDTVTQSNYDAMQTLVLSCLLDPSPQDFMQLLNDSPTLHIVLAGEIQQQFGGAITASSKNL